MANTAVAVFALLVAFAVATSATDDYRCRAPVAPRNGGFSPKYQTYGIRRGVRFFCKAGFKLVGRSWTVCVRRGSSAVWYHPTPVCKRIECPRLQDPDNGDVDQPSSRVPGAKARYSCDRGFNLVGQSTRKCQSNGRWEGDAPVCQKRIVQCPFLRDPDNGDVDQPSSRVPGVKARYSCDRGFNLVGQSIRKCLPSGQWEGDAPVCQRRIECPILRDPQNGDVDQPSRVPGAKARYSCDRGFNLVGQSVRKCLPSGQWEGDAPVCQRRIECPILRDPQNGNVEQPSRVPGAKARYSCDRGFNLVGPSVRKCLPSGQWEGDAPVCQRRIECPRLQDPQNGNVDQPSRVPGAKARYSCDRGFNLAGQSVRKCLPSGQWEGDAPVCRRIECPRLQDPQNGDVDQPTSRVPGVKATYSCDRGFNLAGQSVRKCLPTGQWEGDAPVCERIDCGSLDDPAFGQVSLSGTTFGSTASYTCQTGYILVGQGTRTCGGDGWTGQAPICRIVDCGSLDDPAFGRVSLSGTTFGSTASYTCQTGYTLVGQSTRTCGGDGWTGQAPVCRIVDCGSLENPDFGRVLVPSSTFGSTATYQCREGYVLKGSKTRVCQANGEWSRDAPICKLLIIDCGTLDPPRFGKVLLSGTTAGSTAQYSCFRGYELVGNTRRVCGPNGQWSGSDPVCELIDCGDIDPPEYGWVRIPCSRVGCVARFGCQSGFTKVGGKTRTCSYDGSWSGSSPTCVRDHY